MNNYIRIIRLFLDDQIVYGECVIRSIDEKSVLVRLKLVIQPLHYRFHDTLAQNLNSLGLAVPVVANKDTSTLSLAIAVVNVTVGVVARDILNVVGLVEEVADVVGEGGLLVRPLRLPRTAAFDCVWAVLPGLEHVLAPLARSSDDEACVQNQVSLRVVVVFVVDIFGHRNESLGSDVPEIHQPFDRKLEMSKYGIGVEDNDEFVGLQSLL